MLSTLVSNFGNGRNLFDLEETEKLPVGFVRNNNNN